MMATGQSTPNGGGKSWGPRRRGPIVMYTGGLSAETMNIKLSKNDGDIYLIDLFGVLDLYSSNELKDIIMKMIENKIERIIINLKDVNILNSSGVGALIYISSTLKKINCPLVIIAPEGPVLNALELTRLRSYFTIVSSLKEAVSVAAGRK
jgi:anti-sigma B factor antagonist